MNRHSIDWRGYMPAITTPFTASGDFDGKALAELVEWLVSEGMHGIVVAGTTGEWFSLSPSEKQQLFSIVSAQVKRRIPIVAGCNAYTPAEAIENAARASESKFDGILLTPPPYVMPSDREIAAFYRTVADGVDLPICVYNWPPGTNIDMSRELLEEIAEIEKVVALKNSSENIGKYCEVFFALKDRVRIFGFASNELGLSLLANEGLDGTMGAAGVLGRDQPSIYESVWKGDMDAARRFAGRDATIMRDWFKPSLTSKFGSAQAVFKEALNVQGLPGGYPRMPLLPLLPNERQVIYNTLKGLGRVLKNAS